MIEHCWIPMNDGVRLSARIWLPKTAEAVPAILEYIPYRKRDMVRVRDERNHPVFARHGYAAVRVDMRGSGCSEGVMPDMYAAAELDDALAVINWIANQPWCNGSVGMMGTSWGGTASLQAAACPEAASRRQSSGSPLAAVIAVCATDNRYDDDIHHMGGCLLTDSVEWGAALPSILALPPDPATVGPGWRDMWMQRLEALTFPLENWIRHETRDEYWRHGSVNEQPGAITCPVLAIGGWVDRYSNTVMNLLADNPRACWGIVGPWGHHYPDVAEPGPGFDFQGEALRWWDHWLKGVDNGAADEPRLRIWMQGYAASADRMPTRPGRWVGEASWPSDEITAQRYALDNGRLKTSSPSLRRTQTMVMVPDEPKVGLDAGDTGYFGREGGLPLDQRDDDALSLIFETEPLEAPLELLGHVKFTLQIEADQPIATLVVRLNDVAPDGTVARVTYAVRNLALDEQGRGPRAKDQPVTITLPNTAYRFEVGHRLRLALSSGYWPQIWPAPEPVKLVFDQATACLDLPVRNPPARELPVSFPEPAVRSSPPASGTSLTRTLERGDDGEDVVVGWHQPQRVIRFEDIDLAFASEVEAEHRMPAGDPRRAISRFTYRLSLERQDWSVEVEGTASLTSTSTAFHPEGAIEVKENNKTIFRRTWSKTVKRIVP